MHYITKYNNNNTSYTTYLSMPVLCYVIRPLTQTNTPLWVDVAMVLLLLVNNKIWSPKFKALPSYSSSPLPHITQTQFLLYMVLSL